jgi:hypothetical protein
MSIPVYITNKNRLTPLRNLVDWLLNAEGAGEITVLDTGSTYEPLLDYYRRAARHLNVKFVGEGGLGWAFWHHHMHEEQTGPHIVSDSDVTPSEDCPLDLIPQMLELLNEYYPQGYKKVGPGLRLDNLPDSPWHGEVVQSQQQYWRRRLKPNCFSAAIDTTFAIYKKEFGSTEMHTAVRLDAPYLFEHYPWYVWPLNDEERYYIEHDEYDNGHSRYLVTRGLV